MRAGLVFPHQLFAEHPALQRADLAVLVEDPLLFRQYQFHVRKLILHRASLLVYAESLQKQGIQVLHLRSTELAAKEDLAGLLKQHGINEAVYVDPVDDWLEKKLTAGLTREKIAVERLPDPHFSDSRHRVC